MLLMEGQFSRNRTLAPIEPGSPIVPPFEPHMQTLPPRGTAPKYVGEGSPITYAYEYAPRPRGPKIVMEPPGSEMFSKGIDWR